MRRKSKLICRILLVAAIILSLAGCQTNEQTSEPLLKAQSSFSCDVWQGFLAPSSAVDTDSMQVKITGIEMQIKELQEKITARQNELAALQRTATSDEVQRLENNIKNLQEQITALQNELKKLQDELRVLQNAEKSDEVIALENEIKSLQAQVASLQNTLHDLKLDLSKASNTYQNMVGYIEYIKIGDAELHSDFAVLDPTTNKQLNVVGVISQIFWEGGYAEPILFSCQISESNKTQLAVLTNSVISNTDVAFVFSVYNYDPEAKIYYKCFHTNSVKLQGFIYKSGGELAIEIDTDPSAEVTNPRNYTFTLGVAPQSYSQAIHLAVSSTDKFAKQWGVAVGE
jgi:TolA-binding protein